MTPREVLISAKALIDTPEKWWRGEYRPDSDTSISCVQTATYKAWNSPNNNSADVYCDAMNFLGRATGARYIPSWNDAPERTHAEVMDAFDRAIELAADAETVANLNRDLAAVEA